MNFIILLGAKLLIDDNINFALECAENGIHVCLFGDYSWNRVHIDPKLAHLITRVRIIVSLVIL